MRRQLRVESLTLRDRISTEERHEISERIIAILEPYLTVRQAKFIHCYISFRSEVETRSFIERSLERGIRVVVPVVEMLDGKELLVHTEIRGLTELKKGRFGLEEPIERSPSSLENLDAVLIPLAAFDRNGTRLGYGKGFYDEFLSQLPRSVERIGLAFASQEVNNIPAEPHDEPLDTVVTEREIIRIREIA